MSNYELKHASNNCYLSEKLFWRVSGAHWLYSGGSNTEHSNTEPIRNRNILKIGIVMVRFWNGCDYCHSFVIEPTIQKQYQSIEYKMVSVNILFNSKQYT